MILTPMCLEWDEFQIELGAHLCWQDVTNMGEERIICTCDATYRLTRNLLQSHFFNYDVEETLEYFKKSGWYCDCKAYLDSPNYLGMNQVERCNLADPEDLSNLL